MIHPQIYDPLRRPQGHPLDDLQFDADSRVASGVLHLVACASGGDHVVITQAGLIDVMTSNDPASHPPGMLFPLMTEAQREELTIDRFHSHWGVVAPYVAVVAAAVVAAVMVAVAAVLPQQFATTDFTTMRSPSPELTAPPQGNANTKITRIKAAIVHQDQDRVTPGRRLLDYFWPGKGATVDQALPGGDLTNTSGSSANGATNPDSTAREAQIEMESVGHGNADHRAETHDERQSDFFKDRVTFLRIMDCIAKNCGLDPQLIFATLMCNEQRMPQNNPLIFIKHLYEFVRSYTQAVGIALGLIVDDGIGGLEGILGFFIGEPDHRSQSDTNHEYSRPICTTPYNGATAPGTQQIRGAVFDCPHVHLFMITSPGCVNPMMSATSQMVHHNLRRQLIKIGNDYGLYRSVHVPHNVTSGLHYRHIIVPTMVRHHLTSDIDLYHALRSFLYIVKHGNARLTHEMLFAANDMLVLNVVPQLPYQPDCREQSHGAQHVHDANCSHGCKGFVAVNVVDLV